MTTSKGKPAEMSELSKHKPEKVADEIEISRREKTNFPMVGRDASAGALNSVDYDIKILLVEDELANQFGTKSILEFSGYKVEIANNGKEALNLLEGNEFSLVLMDCSMPVMDGYEATATIRDPTSKVKNHEIPVIGLTAHAMREDRDKCLSVGMNDYLSKPVMIPELLEKLKMWRSTNGRNDQPGHSVNNRH
jgi:CheY-like chemotaxis protein